jgi:dTDP-4-dehydrorhamnose reductase
MKVLVTGARGQVGRALISAAPAGEQLQAVGHAELDIGDSQAVDAYIGVARPDVIVNAAAYTAVDRAENESEAAHRVNAQGPANLARAAARTGARLLHLSTDFVFDGQSSIPYRPLDPTNPLGVYGASKLAGERAVSELLPENSVILRTAWVYDATGKNFVLTMLRLMRERGTVRVVADQIGSPTAAGSIAEALWAIVARPDVTGVNHWTDSGVASWYDFAVAIAEEWAQATGATSVASVIPIGTADYPTPAKRPRFSVLDKTSTSAALGMVPRHWRHNLRQVIGEISIA